MSPLCIDVLGSLRVRRDADTIVIAGDRRRRLLGALVLRRGVECASDWLAHVVWRGSPPPGASATLQSHVAALRRLLDPEGVRASDSAVRTVPGGYMLAADAIDVDADRFLAAVHRARHDRDAAQALRRVDAVLALVRGRPYEDHRDDEEFGVEAAQLDRLLHTAALVRLDALDGLGRDDDVVEAASVLVTTHPFDEQLWIRLATAQYRCIGQAEALRSLQQLRALLADELGVEPMPEVGDLEARVLAHDGRLHRGGSARSGRSSASPPSHYAANGDVHIAYQIVGSSGPWIVAAPPLAQNIEICWEDHHHRRMLERVSTSCRFVHFDKRGTGMSDRAAGLTLEERVQDFAAVMDAVGIDRAVLCGVSEGGPAAIAFAAAHPDRVAGLVLANTYARVLWAPDHPIGASAEQLGATNDRWVAGWGRDPSEVVDWFAPSLAGDATYRSWLAHYMRQSCSPGTLAAINRANSTIDVRHLLPGLTTPTVVVHRAGDRVCPVTWGRYLAEEIRGARYVELPGADHLPWVGENWADVADLCVELAHATRR